jgi:hypothetical protein
MNKHIATFATALLALGATTSADAVPLSAPSGLRPTIEDTATMQTVHCVPGWVHWHRWGWGTGCYSPYVYRPQFYGFYGGPRVYVAPRRVYPYRRWW